MKQKDRLYGFKEKISQAPPIVLFFVCLLLVFFFRVLGNERWLLRNWPALAGPDPQVCIICLRVAVCSLGKDLVVEATEWKECMINNFYMGLELENGGLCARAMPFVAKAISKGNTIYLQKQWVVLYLPDGQKFGILKGKILGPVRWVGVESW